MKVKNISGEPLEVLPLGGRVVMPGETVDIPDQLVWSDTNEAGLVWPASVWRPAANTVKSETKE